MLTQNYLKSILSYDSDTGLFTWLVNKPHRPVGSIAGCYDADGYNLIGITINKKTKVYKAHRLAWFYVYGKWPKHFIDHINCNPVDNRICNLREATNKQNQHNAILRKDNKSGVKGVYWEKSRNMWRASIKIDGKTKNVGLFKNIEDAKIAIDKVRKELHKDYANNGAL